MTVNVALALIMVVIEAAAFMWFSHDFFFGILVLALAAVAGAGGVRFAGLQRFAGVVCAALFLFFVMYALWGPEPARHGDALISYRVTHAAAQFWMAVQCVYLFVRWERVPLLYILSGILAFIFVGDVRLLGWQSTPYQVAGAALLLTVMVLSIRQGANESIRPTASRGRRRLVAIMLAVSLVLGGGVGTALYGHQREIEYLLVDWAPRAARQATTGFTEQSNLRSVQRMRTQGDENVMLRVYGVPNAVYLAGRAFETYVDEEWFVEGVLLEAPSVTPPPWMDLQRQFPSDKVVQLSGIVEDELTEGVIWPDFTLEDAFFRPLDTVYVRTMGWNLDVSSHDSGNFVRGQPGEPYVIFMGDRSAPPANREKLLALPDSISPRIAELAASLTAGAQTDMEKAERIRGYFDEGFSYASGMEVPRQTDAVSHFLLRAKRASCEYYASATVFLLRAAGIPARYVTGFMVVENQTHGGYRIARNKDAHAWVEAYIEGYGWQTIDTTPVEGQPEYRDATYIAYVVDAMQQIRRDVGALLQSRGWQDAWVWLGSHGARVVGLIVDMWPIWVAVTALLAGLSIAWRLWRRWVFAQRARALGPEHPLTPVLLEADTSIRRLGVTRERWETLHGFAERLGRSPELNAEAWATWYRRVGDMRYATTAGDENVKGKVGELRRAIPGVPFDAFGVRRRWRIRKHATKE